MITQEQFARISDVYDYLAERARGGMHDQVEELIEELINRAHGLARVNPEGLDALLAEFEARAGGLHNQWHKVGETCIREAFILGLAGTST